MSDRAIEIISIVIGLILLSVILTPRPASEPMAWDCGLHGCG